MKREERLAQIKGHLEILEAQTCKPLRKSPREHDMHQCPMHLFAPDEDKGERIYAYPTRYGVAYSSYTDGYTHYDIQPPECSDWWALRPRKTRCWYNRQILKWLRSRRQA